MTIKKLKKKTKKIRNVYKDMEILEPLCITDGNVIAQPLRKTVWWFLKKLKVGTSLVVQ